MADFLLGGQIDPGTKARSDALTTVASGDLTTHGVIVGMTGSGKTGLGVVLIEEALSAGVPALLIDPKGDLTNLCLTFPHLAAADFEPWVNEGDATKAGQSVAEFAAAQAAAWVDGLRAWGIDAARVAALRQAVEFTIYTPGSSSGVGLNIVGSLQAPANVADSEAVGDEIDGFVSGLLSLVGLDVDPLSSREHILLSNLILHEWTAGRSLDLPTLVGMVQQPPIRKLGVFEVDQFFPPNDRTALAMRLNGLLASPAFGAWVSGPPLDIGAMLRTPDGRPRCAIVTTAHLSDEERQFVTTLVLSKLVTWMRQQSGTTDLRALLYMDEVAGYLPPTANPPTKKPIMTLMKQARAFGVGVVLSTQNPVDVDYKALANAGTWMIGRLQTEQDKARLLDGMNAASGGVDTAAVGDTIGGLAKRQFVLRRAGKDQPEVFTTRWAMSYLRGPLTRDQIATLMSDQKHPAEPEPPVADTSASASEPLDDDQSPSMPEIADGTDVRWVDTAAPWITDLGGDPTGTCHEAAIVARVALRYDDERTDLVHDDEYEAVLFPLTAQVDAARAVAIDYDDRDLRQQGPASAVYRLPEAPVHTKAFFAKVKRDLVDELVRNRPIELATNAALKLTARPGEDAAAFAARCYAAANERADAETAKLRDKYTAKLDKLDQQVRAASDRVDVLEAEHEGKRNSELLDTAGSILGGLFGGRRSRTSVLDEIGAAASKRGRTAASAERVDAAQNKVTSLQEQAAALATELAEELTEIDQRWADVAAQVTTTRIDLERTDVQVTLLVLAWVPVP